MADEPARELSRVGARRTARVEMSVGEVGAHLAEPAVGVVDALRRLGQQLHRLPRQDDRVGRPSGAGQRTDRRHRLPGLIRVGAGIGVLDVPVLCERADVEQFTDTGHDRGEIPAVARGPQLQAVPQLPVLAEPFPQHSEQLVLGQGGQPRFEVLCPIPRRLPLPRQAPRVSEHRQAEGNQMLAEIALTAIRTVARAGQPASPFQGQFHFVPFRAVDAGGDPSVTDLDPGHRIQVSAPALEGTDTRQHLEVCLGEAAHGLRRPAPAAVPYGRQLRTDGQSDQKVHGISAKAVAVPRAGCRAGGGRCFSGGRTGPPHRRELQKRPLRGQQGPAEEATGFLWLPS